MKGRYFQRPRIYAGKFGRLLKQVGLLALVFSTAFGMTAMQASAAQQQEGQVGDPAAQQQAQQEPVPYQQEQPPYQQQQAAPPQQWSAPAQQLPQTLTIPVGTVITVRVAQFLSSDQNRPGDLFNVTLNQPLVVDGWVMAQRGQIAYGRVAVAQKAKVGHGVSQLGVELSQLTLVDGQQIPVRTQLAQASGRSATGQNVATVGVTTGIGAAIGAAANGGEGAGIGAGIGAAAGIIGVLRSPGRPTEIPPETMLTFQLTAPLTISTVRSQQAFYPVSPQDYAVSQNFDAYRGSSQYAAPQHIFVQPPYPYYGWGYYPKPYYGYYGAYPYRSRTIFIGPRFGGYGRGGRRR